MPWGVPLTREEHAPATDVKCLAVWRVGICGALAPGTRPRLGGRRRGKRGGCDVEAGTRQTGRDGLFLSDRSAIVWFSITADRGGFTLLIPAIIAVVVLILPIGYVLFRKLSVTRQQIEFGVPQNGVSAIYLDIQEDTVRSLYIVFEDGTMNEVKGLAA